MKTQTGFVTSLLMLEEAGKKFARLKPKVRYTLPPIERETLFFNWRWRKVKQLPGSSSERKNSDVITFL